MGTRGAGIVVVRVQTNLVVQTAMHIVQSNKIRMAVFLRHTGLLFSSGQRIYATHLCIA